VGAYDCAAESNAADLLRRGLVDIVEETHRPDFDHCLAKPSKAWDQPTSSVSLRRFLCFLGKAFPFVVESIADLDVGLNSDSMSRSTSWYSRLLKGEWADMSVSLLI